MTETVDVFWSFRSPYSRLVTADLLQLRDDFDVDVQLRVVLPLAVRNPEALFNAARRGAPQQRHPSDRMAPVNVMHYRGVSGAADRESAILQPL